MEGSCNLQFVTRSGPKWFTAEFSSLVRRILWDICPVIAKQEGLRQLRKIEFLHSATIFVGMLFTRK